jgi:hypothetical protein
VTNIQPEHDSSHDSATTTDTTGLDHIFDKTVTPDASDNRRSKKIELPILEAAQALGISERTVWRRIESGELRSRTKNGKRLVKVPIEKTLPSDDTATTPSDTSKFRQVGTVVDLGTILNELNGANFRVGYLQGQLELKEQQLRLLPDLQFKAAEAIELRERVAHYEAELAYLKKPWWKKLFGLD